MIPPTQNAAFIATIEDVVNVYQPPYDAMKPVVKLDKHPVQLVMETRIVYECNRTAANFMFTERLAGWSKAV